MTYNVGNRLTQAQSNLNAVESYGYDASGLRLWKQGPDGVTHVFYNGLDSKPLADFYLASGSVQGGTPMVYFAGKRVDNQSVEDRLGTAVVEGGTTRMAYFPYGEQRSGTSNEVQYATYKRDSVTNLDYAQHRYYSSQIVRFTTPDPYDGSTDPQVPQSFNRYVYVISDPINGNDSTGLDGSPADGCKVNGIWISLCLVGNPTRPTVPNTVYATLRKAQALLSDRSGLSMDCERDIEKIDAQRDPSQRNPDVTFDSVINAAAGASFKSGVGSADPISALYANPVAGPAAQRQEDAQYGPGQTIGNDFARNPHGLTAESVLGGSTIYINPTLISKNLLIDETLLFHEAFHLMGFTDDDLQKALGLTVDPNNTKNITLKLTKDCFTGKDNN